jgi:hypothetical protein
MEREMNADSERVFGPDCTDPALTLYAREIETRLPDYVKFWKQYVGQQQSDSMDTRRKQAGKTDTNRRNFLFLQQFSYKAVWDFVAAWRSHDHVRLTCVSCTTDPSQLLEFAEACESFYARVGACEDALYKCLYVLCKIDENVDWTKERSTKKIRDKVCDTFLHSQDLAKSLGEFHLRHIDKGRNILMHSTRPSGRTCDGNLKTVPLSNYDENKTWGQNLKENWNTLTEPFAEVTECLKALVLLANSVFQFICSEIPKHIGDQAPTFPGQHQSRDSRIPSVSPMISALPGLTINPRERRS